MTTTAELAARVEALHHATEPSMVRFDDGGEFSGRVYLLPSAFNPPTYAHLALLNAASVHGDAAALLSTRNVDKGLAGATLEHRLGMLLETGRAHGFGVFATNAARFVDQARAARATYPGVAFDFIVGFDTLIRIFEPRYYADMEGDLSEFFAHHRVIAANRGEATAETVEGFVSNGAAAQYAGRIAVEPLDDDHAVLSSTEARSQILARGASEVVPPEVAEYIRRHRLYRHS